MHVSNSEYWSDRYQSSATGWDIGDVTPFVADFLTNQRINQLFSDKKTAGGTEFFLPKILVPGCGFGHDALAFAKHGFDVTAVDFAPEPISLLQQHIENQDLRNISAITANFFELPHSFSPAMEFDLIFEYTLFCAIHPEDRLLYSETASSLLSDQGFLLGLFFPLAPTADGPPFGVQSEAIIELFSHVNLHLVSREFPKTSHPARAGREELLLFQKRSLM